MISWLKSWLSRPNVTRVADQPTKPLAVKTHDIAEDNSGQVLMPDIYAEGHADTAPRLKILDKPSKDVDESTGFDPYDTGVLQKK
jgi:hypothetical protein